MQEKEDTTPKKRRINVTQLCNFSVGEEEGEKFFLPCFIYIEPFSFLSDQLSDFCCTLSRFLERKIKIQPPLEIRWKVLEKVERLIFVRLK